MFVRLATPILACSLVFAQDRQQESLDYLEQLRDQGAWLKILEATDSQIQPDYRHRFLRGLALAHLGRLSEAEVELTRAAERAGSAAGEVLVELAGVQFKLKRLGKAITNLEKAISMGQADPYVFDFLASLYYLEGNLEAAVKYWNRIGKPKVQGLKVEPDGVLDPVLLDRALALSPASQLSLRLLRLTDLRLEMLDVFARRRYDLSARPDGDFDLTIQTVEKADVRAGSAFRSWLTIAREAPFRTLHADVRNIHGSALNWSTAFRWKSGNHLLGTRLGAPFRRNPNLLYHAGLTVRDEEWDISSWGDQAGLTGLKLVETRADVTSLSSHRWVWSTGIAASHRDVTPAVSRTASADSDFASGLVLSSIWGARSDLLQIPERRIKLSGHGRWELGRFWSSQGGLFTLGEIGIRGSWEAQKDQRTFITARAQAGSSAGPIPFDRLFRLGMDRDSELPLRGHRGTHDGLKGQGPMGGGYLVSNLDLQKSLYRNAFLSFSAGPFLDCGRILDSRSSPGWMWDPGLEGRLGLLSLFRVAVSYGIDTRSGKTLVFWRVMTE
jgi:hypothetical protein